MIRKYIILAILTACCLSTAEDSKSSAKPENSHCDSSCIDNIIQKMTDEEKIAQLFAVGIYPKNAVKNFFNIFLPGGFTFQARVGNDKTYKLNKKVKTVIQKLNHIQKLSLKKYGFMSFIMVDQEGGTVSRLSRKRHKAFQGSWFFDVATPYMLIQTGQESFARQLGFAVGKVLHSLGFNINMAPVVDVTQVTRKLSFMKYRSFGSDPHLVKKFSKAYIQGLHQAGVIGVFKHFPGYSNSEADTHSKRSVIQTTKDGLLKKDLIPYERAGGLKDPKAVMINIALYPKLDPKNTAPLSSKIITKFLKEELKFPGLVISDSLSMDGFIETDFSQKAIKALQAGNDLILAGENHKDIIPAYRAVVKALKKDHLFSERVNESVKKILTLKSSLSALHDQPMKERLKQFDESMGRLYKINNKIISYNLSTFFKDNKNLKKSIPKDKHLIILSHQLFYHNLEPFLNQWNFFKGYSFFSNRKLKKNLKHLKKTARKNKNHVLKKLQQPDAVFLCYGDAVQTCNAMPADLKEKMIVISTKPHESLVLEASQFLAVVPVYGPALESGSLVLEKMISI